MILLDTHAVFWLAQEPELLSGKAVEAITDARNDDGLAVADKTLWELSMMVSRGQVRVRTSLRDFLAEVERYFTVLPIDGAVAERSTLFSARYPNDPTDRLIGATAVVHGLKLVTADRSIRRSGEVQTVW